MSEHELWNELGNLYFLSGSYNQAVHAYNKAIQLDSGFGKPFSNLALIFTKQAKYDDAIHLYKKSLDLLKDDAEKAITWNRLGNVYRYLRKYQEAVIAYQSADYLRTNIAEDDEPSNQMQYVSSESESLPYTVVEEHRDYQNHSADYLLDVEPEFDEAPPEFKPAEVEMLVNEKQYDQNTPSEWRIETTAEPIPVSPIEDVETPEPVFPEEKPSTLFESVEVDEVSQAESEIEMVEEPGEQVLSKDPPPVEVVAQEPDENVSSDVNVTLVEEDAEVVSDEGVLTMSEAGAPPEEDALKTTSSFSEPIAQPENTIEALPEDLTSALSEAAVYLDNEAPVRDDRLIAPVIPAEKNAEEFPDELGPAITETEIHHGKDLHEKVAEVAELIDQAELADEIMPTSLETSICSEEEAKNGDCESTESITQADDGFDISEEDIPNSVKSANPINTDQQTVKEESKVTENEVGTKEEKLAKQIEINPRNATTWEALGTLYKTAGRYEEAIQAFEQAISIAPGAVSYYHNLGLVYSVVGNNEGAFNAFQKVLELDPNHSLTHASLGGYYKKIGLEELAQQHIGKAMKQIYESENEYNRACLNAICGNSKQAIELLRTALEKKQTFVDWVLHDPDLDSLRDDVNFKQLIGEFSR